MFLAVKFFTNIGLSCYKKCEARWIWADKCSISNIDKNCCWRIEYRTSINHKYWRKIALKYSWKISLKNHWYFTCLSLITVSLYSRVENWYHWTLYEKVKPVNTCKRKPSTVNRFTITSWTWCRWTIYCSNRITDFSCLQILVLSLIEIG